MISVEHLFKFQDEYIQACQQYIAGEMEGDTFFPKASAMGIYRQRKPGTWMVRARILSGNIRVNQLRNVSRLGKQYSHGQLHLTTRQDIQFHKVSIQDTIHIVQELKNNHIINKGAGGNSIRNILVPHMSGVSKEEVFDVTPYGMLVTDYVLGLKQLSTLPRKFKIAFSHDKNDSGRTQYADIGFLATVKNGIKGFTVYGGGGLGNQPGVGICLQEFIPADQVIIYTHGMLRFFEDYGDRDNRHKARMRFVRYRLGDLEFLKIFHKYVEEVGKENPSINVENILASYEQTVVEDQEDYIELTPQNGDIQCEDIDRLIEWIEHKGIEHRIRLRLTANQGMLVFGLKTQEKEEMEGFLKHIIAQSDIEQTLSCTGARECRIGLCDSVYLREQIIHMATQYPLEQRRQLPKIFISGCRNACGWHLVGAIGFSGKKIRTIHGVEECFDIFIDGKVEAGQSKIGENIGTLSVSQCITFLNRIFNKYLEILKENRNVSFHQYIQEDNQWIRQTLKHMEKEIIHDGKA